MVDFLAGNFNPEVKAMEVFLLLVTLAAAILSLFFTSVPRALRQKFRDKKAGYRRIDDSFTDSHSEP